MRLTFTQETLTLGRVFSGSTYIWKFKVVGITYTKVLKTADLDKAKAEIKALKKELRELVKNV